MKPQLIISDGRSQTQRQLPALNGDYFQLDEMRFEQILAIANEYARLVHFYQIDLSIDGNWQQFFGTDESILMASILAIDTNKLSNQFELRIQGQPQYREWFRDDIVKKIDASYRDVINSPLLFVRLLNQWLTALRVQQSDVAIEVRKLLEGILRGLKWEIQTLCNATPRLLLPYTDGLCSKSFKDLVEWPAPRLRAPASDGNSSSQEQEIGEEKTFTKSEILHNFHAFNQALRMLQNGIKKLLPLSMLSGKHDPAVSLLIGFVSLYQQLQVRLNRFGDKHIDFYYHKVLGMQLQQQRIDSAYLVIKPSPAARSITIAKGTEFTAGVDQDQNDIVYTADEATQLNNARVSSLHSIYFEKHHGETKLLVTKSSYQRSIAVLRPDCEVGEHEKLPPLPLLGAPKPGEHLADGQPTRFGFAIASHTLLMQEGERSIRLLFKFRQNEKYTIDETLKSIAEQLQTQGKREHLNTSSLEESDVFVKLLRSMFRISISTLNGWYVVPEYRPEYYELNSEVPKNCLAIHITLPSSTPAITPYQEKLHAESLQTKTPVIRFEMTQNEYAYPYDILTHWLLEEIDLEINVKACRQLVLHNQIGQVSALAPFMPFGPIPDLSSYLVIGCEEVLGKQLRDVSLDIEWAGLPNALGGFSDYYRGYQTPLKADDVNVKLAVLVDGKWSKAPASVPLFQYETNENGSASNQVNIENRISLKSVVSLYKPTRLTQLPKAGTRLTYTSATMNGMFKISLDAPEGAFGHQEYPQLLTRVLTQNAQTKKIGSMQGLPNPPYTPQISRIVFNYKAFAKINFDQSQSDNPELPQEQFLHLHPLGWEVMRANESKQISLIPKYPAAGNLMIGLQAEQLRGPLSLYFYLREDSLPMTKIHHTGLSWWYLASNKWKRLQQAQILDDSTHGFMTSGIVQLQLPDEINRDNTIMSSDQFWIGVTADYGIERFCSLYAVFAQAIKVSWSPTHGMKPAPILPALSLNKSRSLIVGVDSILQVRASFNGKAEETKQQFRTRASERLLHKNRALTAADYELLILEQFPQVFKVKCFSHLCSDQNPRTRVRPGHLLIVPIPYLNQSVHANQKPTLSGHLIHEIQTYIEKFASADVMISVENPVYEEVQVRCTVKLKTLVNNSRMSGQMSGRYIEQINQAICDYLSPWNDRGLNQHFGWTIQQNNIISFLHDLDYIDEVTGVSLLQISTYGDINDLRFKLTSNAKAERHQKNLTPSYPWSITVPMNEHWIVIVDQFEQKAAKAIGINELKVGSTFIIPSRKEI
ncbi:hypothetical protein [Solimicrobium silvestre]|uniref:Baseplate J-like protein n=1 Tax=Solimicrobium silvestre TaxID=2099400 RepID=A0A2S9H0H6_9BURK|nr:hypothetical protein [Solimicrobium silvestre]PRC93450.1 hypothetical protein S2091_1837 [Solimicrobium silvestre]